MTIKDLLLYSIENSAQFIWQPGWEGSLGGMDTCISMAEFLCCVPESIKTLLIGYTPIQNKKFNIKSASKL